MRAWQHPGTAPACVAASLLPASCRRVPSLCCVLSRQTGQRQRRQRGGAAAGGHEILGCSIQLMQAELLELELCMALWQAAGDCGQMAGCQTQGEVLRSTQSAHSFSAWQLRRQVAPALPPSLPRTHPPASTAGAATACARCATMMSPGAVGWQSTGMGRPAAACAASSRAASSPSLQWAASRSERGSGWLLSTQRPPCSFTTRPACNTAAAAGSKQPGSQAARQAARPTSR